MAQPPCRDCSKLDVAWRKHGEAWQQKQTVFGNTDATDTNRLSDVFDFEFDITIIKAHAAEIKKCPRCRSVFAKVFQIPDLWWKKACKRSNGYFGCEETMDDQGKINGFITWARFLVKQHLPNVDSGASDIGSKNYVWYKLNMLTYWLPSTKQTIMFVFDAPAVIADQLPELVGDPHPSQLGDPFWIYDSVVDMITTLQDEAVWAIRDQVRHTETSRVSPIKPQPKYLYLHEICRHAIHVSETLNVATKTIQVILLEHKSFMDDSKSNDAATIRAAKHLQRRLRYHEHMLQGLQHRSVSNKARLMNEIQLAFNTVAQYDSGVSVQIGRAAQMDSEAMKTISFLTLTFLPATFISAIFSTSFFNYNGGSEEWSVSTKFWLYWAVAIPITVITSVLWYWWPKIFRPTLVGDEDGDGHSRYSEENLVKEKGKGDIESGA